MNELYQPQPLKALGYALLGLVLLAGFLFWYVPWVYRRRDAHQNWLAGLRRNYNQAFVPSGIDHWSNLEQLERMERLATQLDRIAAPTLVPVPAPAPAPAAAPAPALARVPAIDLTALTAVPTRGVPAPTGPPGFERGEPESLAEFESQGPIVSYLSAMIQALDGTKSAVAPIVFTGPAGTGKTALMKAFANSLRLRNLAAGLGETDYLELFPADISDRADLERVLRRAAVRPSVLRIDELHTIDREHAVLLYEILASGVYRFQGDTSMTPMHNVTIIAATTDWAMLHEALRRRFEHMAFEPLTPEEIAAAVRRRPFPIDESALSELVKRTAHAGVLWEALRYFKQGETYARAAQASVITQEHMELVYSLNALDAFGLTATDRRVISTMLRMPRTRRGRDNKEELVAYGGAETQIAQVAQVDLGAFRQIIKPKLLARSLLTTRPGYGQVLTERAITLYQGLVM